MPKLFRSRYIQPGWIIDRKRPGYRPKFGAAKPSRRFVKIMSFIPSGVSARSTNPWSQRR